MWKCWHATLDSPYWVFLSAFTSFVAWFVTIIVSNRWLWSHLPFGLRERLVHWWTGFLKSLWLARWWFNKFGFEVKGSSFCGTSLKIVYCMLLQDIWNILKKMNWSMLTCMVIQALYESSHVERSNMTCSSSHLELEIAASCKTDC
jgi:hypothetical protein